MRNLNLLIPIILIMACTPQQTDEETAQKEVILDLTHPYNEETVFWPTAEKFVLDTVANGMTEKGYFYSANNFHLAEHGGTHMDAPYHFWKEGNTVDEIPVDQLTGKGIVIDVSDSALANPDYQISVEDFKNWEADHGTIPEGSIVLVKTGFGQYWPDAEQYMGTAERGAEAVAKLHFPGLHPDAAEWITSERNIKMIGLDTPSIDYGQSTLYESHVILFSNNIPALENVANMDQLPVSGFTITALPIKIEGGSGGPARIIARWEE